MTLFSWQFSFSQTISVDTIIMHVDTQKTSGRKLPSDISSTLFFDKNQSIISEKNEVKILHDLIKKLNTIILEPFKNCSSLTHSSNTHGLVIMVDCNGINYPTELDSISTLLQIEAHTDSDADSLYNIALSQKRGLYAIDLLAKIGLTKDNLKYSFFGEDIPLNTNSSEIEKSLNRRVNIFMGIVYDWACASRDLLIYTYDTLESITTINGYKISNYNSEFKLGIRRLPQTVEIKEYLTMPNIIANNLNTLDKERNILESGGMFSICPDPKLKKGDTLWYTTKVPLADYNPNYKIYKLNRNSLWENPVFTKTYVDNKYGYYIIPITNENQCTMLNPDCKWGCGNGNTIICNSDSSSRYEKYMKFKRLQKIKLYGIDTVIIRTKGWKKRYTRIYACTNYNKSLVSGKIINSKKAANPVIDTCILSNNLVVSIVQKGDSMYVALKKLEDLPFKKSFSPFLESRFIFKKNDYQKTTNEMLENTIDKIAKKEGYFHYSK